MLIITIDKMMHNACWSGVALLYLISAVSVALAQPVETVERAIVRAENPLPMVREDEVVSVPWTELRTRLATGDQVRVRDIASGTEAVTQVVDSDGDGQADELLFLASFRPEETREFAVEAAPSSQAPESRVHAAHHAERDDVAWENDRVAFRTYGAGLWELEDLVSSGIDVWLKRVPKLVIDEWYADGHYHTDTGEGADFFKVGPTLGAGGTAVWREGQLHRAPNFSSYRILADGPIRTIVELEYGPWDAGGIQVAESKRIMMEAGEYLFRSESVFRTDEADELTYATGLVKRPDVVGSMRQAQPWAWLSIWGPVESDAGGHGDLGTAVLLNQEHLTEMRETDDHYLALATATPGEPAVHFVGAGWTATEDFEDVEDWWAYLNEYVRRLQAPLHVEVLADEESQSH